MSEPEPDSVAPILERLKAGDRDAAAVLIERYWDRVVRLAGRKLSAGLRRRTSDESIAASVFESLYACCAEQKFGRGGGSAAEGKPDRFVASEEHLWMWLCDKVSKKVANQAERHGALKRNYGREVGEADLTPKEPGRRGLDGISPENARLGRTSAERPPDLEADMRDKLARLLSALPTPELSAVAILYMEGHTRASVARELGVSVDRVKTWDDLIRRTWKRELGTDDLPAERPRD